MMLNWLRNKLKKWLADEHKVDALECFIDRKIVRVAVVDVVGLKLMVTNGMGTWIVGPEQCFDRAEFWRAWEQRTPGDYVWEDGSKFKAKEMVK